MKIAIFSDIHANFIAFLKAYSEAKKLGVDKIFILGDIIGYGPNPKECVGLARIIAEHIVMGNHEDGAVDMVFNKADVKEKFNDVAFEALEFTKDQLDWDELHYLSMLPESIVLEDLNTTLVHGSLEEPKVWTYINNEEEARRCLDLCTTRACFVGHTHQPFVFSDRHGLHEFLPDNLTLLAKDKYLINVGSVGQPRDGDCRLSFGLLDVVGSTMTFNLHKCFYQIPEVEAQIKKAGLPMWLSERLYLGQ